MGFCVYAGIFRKRVRKKRRQEGGGSGFGEREFYERWVGGTWVNSWDGREKEIYVAAEESLRCFH